jgi:hypothetical protein
VIRVTKIGQWGQAVRVISQITMKLDLGIDIALGREAQRVNRAIKSGLISGAPGGQRFKMNSDKTVALKGSSKELLATGTMLRSVKVTKLYPKIWFVGIHRSEPANARATAKGMTEADIGAIHEFGAPTAASTAVSGGPGGGSWYFQTVTQRQSKFFRWAHKYRGIFPVPPKEGDLLMMSVPARPFIRPVWDAMKDESVKRVSVDILRFIGVLPYHFGKSSGGLKSEGGSVPLF